MTGRLTESEVESAALGWLEALGWQVLHGPHIAPGEAAAERTDYGEVVLAQRLREALATLNPKLPAEALEDAFRKLTRPQGATLEARNRALHRLMVDGVTVEYREAGGAIRGAQARAIDFQDVTRNDWLAVNQFTVTENKRTRRLDLVLFVNGLPLVFLELKNAAGEEATVESAFRQFQTYKAELPALFAYNALLCISDGLEALIGTLTAGREWFKPWRTISGEELANPRMPALRVMVEGVFEKRRLLEMLEHFLVFEDDGSSELTKKMAGYHQFHAVQVAVRETLRAAQLQATAREARGRSKSGEGRGGEPGDRRIGVVWHTQGSGKSLTMVFYAGCVIREPAMANPTIVVLTDRNDLDDQLFGTFSRCRDLLRQPPEQAESRADLRAKLVVDAGGVVFTTIQKFLPEEKGDRHPELSARRNIVVIADEAHRSQYDFIDGFARHLRDALPGASFIGFTGTPIEIADKSTRSVFGDTISVYDIQRAVEDKATVPIYYESRLAKLALKETERPRIDPRFEEVTEGEEVERKEKLKSRWAQLEAIVGSEKRLKLLARDIVEHFEKRLEAMDGKAMVVCMSRRICMDLHDEIVKLRPGWFHAEDDAGAIKVIMTGNASEGPRVAGHARNKLRREAIAKRFRNPNDPLRLVLVRDMWLTGFDAPCLHSMYLDKPMRGHGLMQAIARVNRVFRDKPGGLVVDYLGLAHELKAALATYTESGGTGRTAINQAEAVALMLEKHEVCSGLFHGFDWSPWLGGPAERLGLLRAAQEHILAQENGKDRLLSAVRDLSQAFALSVPHPDALRIRDDVAFFQTVRASLAKRAPGEVRTEEELDLAVRQIVSRAVASEGVVDIFAAAGLQRPDISILSEEFLAEVRGMPQRNLAVELLRKLLSGDIRNRRRKNVVQARSFADMLEQSLRRYQNRAIEAAQVIEELIALARRMREAGARGEALGLSDDEVAFYDALETNDSAVKVLGDHTLRAIARELVATVRNNVTIDWTLRETVQAQLRVLVRRILRKHGYPPDKQEKATQTVLEQAEVLSEGWATAEPSRPIGFRPPTVQPRIEDRYVTCVPLVPLKAAAGSFSDPQAVEEDEVDWVAVSVKRPLSRGMFVAQVTGHSMEPLIPDGSYCLFRAPVTGTREGKVVLVGSRGIADPETGGKFTVKQYSSEKTQDGEGGWRHTKVVLSPSNPAYQPIVILGPDVEEVRVIAELVEVLGPEG
jgi:type I restriction enzyme R subunit